MPIYFFNIRDGRDVFDTTGTDLRGRREVRSHMIAIAMEFFDSEGRDHQGEWEMEAIDDVGKIIATMSFSSPKDKL